MNLSRLGLGTALAFGVFTTWLGACSGTLAEPCGANGVLNGTCQSGPTCSTGTSEVLISDPSDSCPESSITGATHYICCVPVVDASADAGADATGPHRDATAEGSTPPNEGGTGEASPGEGGPADSGALDTGAGDTGSPEAAPLDTGAPDASDSGPSEAGPSDTGPGDAMDAGTDGPAACSGGAKTCTAVGDCPAATSLCAKPACAVGCCAVTNAPLGTACTDNGGVVCDGNGSCISSHCTDGVKDADETDKDCGGATCAKCENHQDCIAAGDCVSGVCQGGLCVGLPAGTACQGNTACASDVCDVGGTGFCCAAACTGGACGATSCAAVTGACVYPGATVAPASLQTPGDCQSVVCNGSGGSAPVDDPTDLPTSTSACLLPACSGLPLAPSFVNAPVGTACTSATDATAHVCGALTYAGVCVECNTTLDCTTGTCSATDTCQ